MSENRAVIAPVLFYMHEHCCLSNFSAFAVEIDRRVWMTAQHAYQAAKFRGGFDHIADYICDARSPHQANKIAREYDSLKRSDWQDVKVAEMKSILEMKFAQHPYIQAVLKKTGTAYLCEDSPKDSFWGSGPDGKGRNMLGRLWMQIRDGMLLNVSDETSKWNKAALDLSRKQS